MINIHATRLNSFKIQVHNTTTLPEDDPTNIQFSSCSIASLAVRSEGMTSSP